MYGRTSFVALLLCLFALHGCGGSGKGISKTTPVKLSIVWGERSRAINAPSSALSATATLANANVTGGDFTYSVNRDPAPQTYTGNYTSANSAKTGPANLTIRFYAQSDGSGAVVGIAQAKITLQADGTGIGNVVTANTIASVAVPAGQTARVGQTKDLIFTAQDATGSIVAVTPGSATFTVADGGDKLQIVGGQAKALATGTATVRAALDGKTSAATPFTINPLTPTSYTITDLGTLTGDTEAYATSINSQGSIVGYSYGSESSHAFLWRDGILTDMGIVFSGVSGHPTQINDLEQVTGTMGSSFSSTRSFFWANGVTSDLGTLGGTSISATSINNHGVIVGNAQTAANESHAFMWQAGKLTDLGAFTANAINDSGMITGDSGTPVEPGGHAITWQNGTVTDLGAGTGSTGYAINAAGHVTGHYNGLYSFFWKDGVITDVRYMQGRSGTSRTAIYEFIAAYGLNDLDQVVGGGGITPRLSGSYAFILSEGQFINPLSANTGWELYTARSINANGWIVGEGKINGHIHAFLLTPQ